MANQNEQDLHIMANLLKTIPLFETLDEQAHAEIIRHAMMEYYPGGHTLFKEGDQADCMYIIKSGMVRIYHAGETASFDQQLAMLGDNDFFGEMALVSESVRNATAQTVEPTQAFIIKKDDFIKLISTNPAVAEKISRELLDRVKQNARGEKPAQA